MTAVLSATDALRRDSINLGSLDDNQMNYSSPNTDWRLKYIEVADMLAETRAELDEFHYSSKELEEELIRELERTEKAQQDLKVKVAQAETDRDDWKGKFVSLQTTHNTSTTLLQRELDKLRQEHQVTKIRLRELEMGNDDLERSERAVSSSLADAEAKYSRALEEKILLEHELLDKANLEEESQRLKDELRDAILEISVLKDRLAAQENARTADGICSPSQFSSHITQTASLHDDLLREPPPPDLRLSDLSPSSEDLLSAMMPPPEKSSQSVSSQSGKFNSSIARVSSMRTPVDSLPVSRGRLSSGSISTAIPVAAAKSKGVQMVSEMRARVRNLEQKIHTRVPRLRMGSFSGRSNANATSGTSPSTVSKTSTKAGVSDDKKSMQRRSSDIGGSKRANSSNDTSGWVLVMEESLPAAVKSSQTEKRSAPSPVVPTGFRSMSASTTSASPSAANVKSNPLAQSAANGGTRRPQSRLSSGSLSSAVSSSSIPTVPFRSTTPTLLPVPSTGLYSSTSGGPLRHSTGPGKRASLGSSTSIPSMSALGDRNERMVDVGGWGVTNTTVPRPSRAERASAKVPTGPDLRGDAASMPPPKFSASCSGVTSLSRSRIGRPSTSSGGRQSVEVDESGRLENPSGKKEIRMRSGTIHGRQGT